MSTVILSIDPGTEKCGVALLDRNGNTLSQAILQLEDLETYIRETVGKYIQFKTVIGNSTGLERIIQILKPMKIKYDIIDEQQSSLEARKLYFKNHPPRGLKRLLPKGLLIPPVAIDDWSAVVIGHRYLAHLVRESEDHDTGR